MPIKGSTLWFQLASSLQFDVVSFPTRSRWSAPLLVWLSDCAISSGWRCWQPGLCHTWADHTRQSGSPSVITPTHRWLLRQVDLWGFALEEIFRRKICLFVKWNDEFECSTNFSEIIIWWRRMKLNFVKLTFSEIQPTLNELYQPKLTQLNYNRKQYYVPQKVCFSDGRGLFLGIHSGYKEGS